MIQIPEIIHPDYYYDLPPARIAQYPLPQRDASRLLVYRNSEITTGYFRNLDNYLESGTLMVFNNSRVIRARIIFYSHSGARIEILCLEPEAPSEYSKVFITTAPVEWKCLVGNLKRWKAGKLETKFIRGDCEVNLFAEKLSGEGDAHTIRFSWTPGTLNFGDVIESAGHIPLPPYITRNDEEGDVLNYQTIYATVKGSVAAPTAGLHFTSLVFENLRRKGIGRTDLTLHVGAGTFQPLKSPRISEHVMHTEHIFVGRKTLETIIRSLGKIIAVGTTSVRTLESLYWLGVKIHRKYPSDPSGLFVTQWEPYETESTISAYSALETLIDWMKKKDIKVLKAPTGIFIVPGYRFRTIDGMVTNFHLPGSTLLLLVSAWTGEAWKKIYSYALQNDFRFLSYGDSSLLLR